MLDIHPQKVTLVERKKKEHILKGKYHCLGCDRILTLDKFDKSNKTRVGYELTCIECLSNQHNMMVQASRKEGKHRRRAYKANAQGSHTYQELQNLLIKQGHKCIYCNCCLKSINVPCHADHIVPLSRNGTDYIENIAIACPYCNCSKSNKTLYEWVEYIMLKENASQHDLDILHNLSGVKIHSLLSQNFTL